MTFFFMIQNNYILLLYINVFLNGGVAVVGWNNTKTNGIFCLFIYYLKSSMELVNL